VPAVLLRPVPMAITFVLIGLIGAVGSSILLVPAVRAARGGGVTGTFTLTALGPCSNYPPPPRQRCTWFGDFRSDDGRTVRRDVELYPQLPPSAWVGDPIPARDTGDMHEVFRRDDTGVWRMPALFLGLSSGVVLIGIAVSQPWMWRTWLRRRREIGRHRL